ncbi:MAG: DUF4340 domain-containing protein [Moorea sp. SIO2B7]|nr:DUF4340 domain-containing protein [Moorena sp. SIO2B7]
MKLQKTTWILLVIALALGGFVYFYEIQGKAKREAIQAKEKQIFDFDKEEIKSFKIEKKYQTLEFEQTDSETKPWQMKQPEDVQASDAAVSFLVNLLVKGKSDRSFTISSKQKQKYGLEQPIATVKINLKNEEKHELILGNPNFDNKFIYAQVDPSSQTDEEIKVFLVPIELKYGVEKEIEEWKQKEEDEKKIDAGKVKPDAGKVKPDAGKVKPDAEKVKPDTEKVKPDTEKDKPDTGKDKPDTGKDKPDTGKDKPDTGKVKPDTGKDKPDTGKDKPDTGKVKPDAEKVKPDAEKDKPNSDTELDSKTEKKEDN